MGASTIRLEMVLLPMASGLSRYWARPSAVLTVRATVISEFNCVIKNGCAYPLSFYVVSIHLLAVWFLGCCISHGLFVQYWHRAKTTCW